MNRRQGALLLVAGVVAAGALAAAYLAAPARDDSGKMRVVATFYPLFYFASEIGGERARVESLIPFNSEPHSWEPSPGGIVTVDSSRVFIYNGAGLEPWVEDLLGALRNRGSLVVVDASEGLNLSTEFAPDERGGESERGGGGAGHDHTGVDPHVWLDPLLAAQQVERILVGFVEADPAGEAYYSARAEGLRSRLLALHAEFEGGLRNRTKSVIVTTHEGFGHLARRYNFTAEAVLGLSPDEQPSATQIARVAEIVRQNDLSVVYGEPVYDDQYIRTVAAEVSRQTGREIRVLILDGIHGRAGPHAEMDYFEIMRENLRALREGLGVA